MDIIKAKHFLDLLKNFLKEIDWSQAFGIDEEDLRNILKRTFTSFITFLAFLEFFYFDLETGNLEPFDDTDSELDDDSDYNFDEEEDEDLAEEEEEEPVEDFLDLVKEGSFYGVLICLLWIHYKLIEYF